MVFTAGKRVFGVGRLDTLGREIPPPQEMSRYTLHVLYYYNV